MKQYLTVTLLVLVTFACSEDDPQPSPWVGNWYLSDPVGPIEISFQIAKENAGTATYNAEVIHPAIPEQHQRANNMFVYDPFENGYGRIEIISRSNFYYKITLIYNRFVEEEDGAYMDVYDVQVDIEGQEHVVLPDRSFRRIRAN